MGSALQYFQCKKKQKTNRVTDLVDSYIWCIWKLTVKEDFHNDKPSFLRASRQTTVSELRPTSLKLEQTLCAVVTFRPKPKKTKHFGYLHVVQLKKALYVKYCI